MRRYLIPVLVLAAAACDRQPDPTAPGDAAPAASLALTQLSQDPTPDPLAVAQAVPGFGGYFIDESGAPTVWLTDPGRRPEAERALAGFLASFGWTASDLRVRQADYDYLQLDAWYRAAWPRALAVPGAVATDLDERRNRLRFGGVDAAALAGIVSALAELDVPRAAAVVELRGPVRNLATLRDKVRPPHGGFQIQFFALPASPVLYQCTLGFNAVQDGVNSFITNSHCTNVQGGTDLRTDYYQSTRGGLVPNPDNFVAFEVEDPVYTSGGECPLGRTCRYADASRAQYGAGQAFSLGRVARAAVLNTTNVSDDTATLRIDAVSPHFSIVGEQATPVQGQTLNKVGRTTGWTQGAVTSTCENVNVSDSQITNLCQSFAAAYVAAGDSGSPIFGFNTDGTVNLAGILWGGSTNLVTGAVELIFSPLANVERELGELKTFEPSGGKRTKKAK